MNTLLSFSRNIRLLVNHLSDIFKKQYFFPPELSLAVISNSENSFMKKNRNSQSILEDIIGNGFLWAVPKHRRSLERRMTRRMGFGKMITLKKNLIVCDACGHFHPHHTICGNCYEQVRKETEILQEAVMKEFKLEPIEQEVKIVYESDSKETRSAPGKRIVELPKERPQWFCKNLLEKDSEFKRRKTIALSDSSITPKIENA